MAVRYPVGVDDGTFRRVLEDEFGIFVIGNIGVFEEKSFRVGLMSPPQIAGETVIAVAEAIAQTIQRFGKA